MSLRILHPLWWVVLLNLHPLSISWYLHTSQPSSSLYQSISPHFSTFIPSLSVDISRLLNLHPLSLSRYLHTSQPSSSLSESIPPHFSTFIPSLWVNISTLLNLHPLSLSRYLHTSQPSSPLYESIPPHFHVALLTFYVSTLLDLLATMSLVIEYFSTLTASKVPNPKNSQLVAMATNNPNTQNHSKEIWFTTKVPCWHVVFTPGGLCLP